MFRDVYKREKPNAFVNKDIYLVLQTLILLDGAILFYAASYVNEERLLSYCK